jgi:hypothetical protein
MQPELIEVLREKFEDVYARGLLGNRSGSK